MTVKKNGLLHLFFSFEGRINRAKYWLISVSLVLILMPIVLVMYQISVDAGLTEIGLALGALFIWRSLALQIKRCHDRNRSDWFILINLIPFIGPIWLMIELGFLRGTKGNNRFGTDPHSADDLHSES